MRKIGIGCTRIDFEGEAPMSRRMAEAIRSRFIRNAYDQFFFPGRDPFGGGEGVPEQEVYFGIASLVALIIVGSVGFVLGGIWGAVIGVIAIAVGIRFFFPMATRSFKRDLFHIAKVNEEDYQMSQRVLEIPDILRESQLNDKVTETSGLNNWKGLIPLRVDPYSPQDIKANLQGALRGNWGLFTFQGEFSGRSEGSANPSVADMSFYVVCETPNHESIGVIVQSPRVLQEALAKYFDALSEEYGEGSHTAEAINAVRPSVLDRLAELNPQRLYNAIVHGLEIPRDSRPRLDVEGIPGKTGTLYATGLSYGTAGAETIVPLGFLHNMRDQLQERLPNALAPVPLM